MGAVTVLALVCISKQLHHVNALGKLDNKTNVLHTVIGTIYIYVLL